MNCVDTAKQCFSRPSNPKGRPCKGSSTHCGCHFHLSQPEEGAHDSPANYIESSLTAYTQRGGDFLPFSRLYLWSVIFGTPATVLSSESPKRSSFNQENRPSCHYISTVGKGIGSNDSKGRTKGLLTYTRSLSMAEYVLLHILSSERQVCTTLDKPM